MPPRKKAAAAADGDAPAPTRSSTRTRNAAAAVAAPAPKPASKPKSKRAREASDEDEEDEEDPPAPPKKPVSKRAKKVSQDDDNDDDEDEDSAPAKKPVSKKPASKKLASKKPASKKAAAKAADDDEDVDMDPPAKMVTVVKRGRAPVDPKSGKVNTHQVYADETVWDAMLNQTNVGANNNKFYVLQLLHPIGNASQAMLYTRWGRVGIDGSTQIKGPWPVATAINEFKKQFKAKAGVDWEDRVGMVTKKGKYTWLERDYGDEDEEEGDSSGKKKGKGKDKKEKGPPPASTLKTEVLDLCNIIFSTAIIDATLSSMNYDANKLPLGKLAKATILKGFAALKTLSEVIQTPNGQVAQAHGGFSAACDTLSGAYYSIIPHDFGMRRPVSINTKALLEKELELVDALGDMEIASKLMESNDDEDEEGNAIHPMDANFRSLGLTAMDPVDRTSTEFTNLEKYMRDTHGQTHGHIKASVIHAFRVERAGESDHFVQAGHDQLPDGERLLLWHGSRSTNFGGILSQGLRIAPPEAPVTGYMFGKGVYFADMMSKSAGYCCSYLSNGVGLMLLAEVAAKPFYERTTAVCHWNLPSSCPVLSVFKEYDADKGCKKAKKLATKGLGSTQPGDWKDAGEALDNDALRGVHMPEGKPVDSPIAGGHLLYNEYIVYDTAQIRLKYLLMVQM
ncbi:unnamed protein product [Mycena citricolor]|uniref:Poly [ADP-ribose] polymerase n=1 Tax=Mycena citricolor TaxID=2018698 RepID=A0AAD2HQL7_9AGAR|nr:unnamed protein product [Mycena citricolor]